MKIIKFFLNFKTPKLVEFDRATKKATQRFQSQIKEFSGCADATIPIDFQVQTTKMVEFDRQKVADVTARALSAVATSNR